MKLFKFALLILFITGCDTPVKEKEYAFRQVGWTINIPSDFDIIDSAGIAEQNKKGQTALEKTYDTTLNFTETKTLISFKKGKLNTFTSTITPFDIAKDGSWNEANQGLKEVLFETFRTQMPDVKIDTSSTVEKINNIPFDRFHTKIVYPNGVVLHSYLFSQLRNGFDFGVTITYSDEKMGDRLKKILNTSKFE